jgi:hypothetical protein
MEIAGIPVVIMIYPDQANFFKQICLNNGCPNVRFVDVPRIGEPEEMVATYYDKIAKALTDPLTAKEKEAGLYSPPAPPRVLFEGTIDEAQNFLQQTILIENCRNCPIAKYTDGLPVIIPTEEKVAEMLTGTSHSPSEVITRPTATSTTSAFTQQITYAQKYTSTVEKTAICAVMAGCKPQYMPACLAIAAAGGASTNCPGTSSMVTSLYVVSGPYAKEIGMNAGQESMDVGNQANMTLGRVGALMTVNFGGCIMGLVRTDSGNLVHSVCFAEDLDGLPPGWIGLNEESTYYDATAKANVNYTSKQSVIGKISMSQWFIMNAATYPGYFRTMNTGQMGIARMLGVAGTPGHYNWMEYILPKYIELHPAVGGVTFLLHNNMAELMYEAGFKSKDSIYKWMWDTYYITVEQHYNTGLWEFPYDNGKAIEPTSGKSWNDLLATAPDYKLHALGGSNYKSNCVIMGDSFADEHYYLLPGGRPGVQPIDVWR